MVVARLGDSGLQRQYAIRQFLREQLAGDLLPNATEAQLIATGFNRNHMITHEGGTIPEENLTNYVADRVKTTSEVFLGLTFGCAQCLDHKYDPFLRKSTTSSLPFLMNLMTVGLMEMLAKMPCRRCLPLRL